MFGELEYPENRVYEVRTKDSYGVDDSAVFEVTSSISFEPATVNVGSTLRITVSDWDDPYEDVVAVRIAGQLAHITGVAEYGNCFENVGGTRQILMGRFPWRSSFLPMSLQESRQSPCMTTIRSNTLMPVWKLTMRLTARTNVHVTISTKEVLEAA